MNKLTRYIFIAAGVAIAAYLAWYFSNIVFYILISAVLSLVGRPLVNFLSKLHIGQQKFPRTAAAAITLTTLWAIFLLFFFVLSPLFTRLANQLSAINFDSLFTNINTGIHYIQDWIITTIPGMKSDFNLSAWLGSEISTIINETTVINMFGSVANMLVGIVIGIFSVTFITFFFLKEDGLFFEAIIIFFPVKHENSARHALSSVTQLLMRYFIGIFVEVCCIMILITIGLMLVGLPFSTALVLGFISGVLNVIPYIGPIVSMLIGCVIGIATTFNTLPLIIPLLKISAVYLIVNLIDNAFFQPYIYSNSIKAHPLEIFFVILIAGSLAGILGMIVAIPAYMVIRVFAKEFFNRFKVVQKLTGKM